MTAVDSGDEEEKIRLILVNDALDFPGQCLDFLRVVLLLDLLHELVDLGVFIPHEVQLLRIRLGRMPDLIGIVVGRSRPAQHRGLEIQLVDEFGDEDRPFIDIHLHFHPDGAKVVLHQRGDVFADLGPLIA